MNPSLCTKAYCGSDDCLPISNKNDRMQKADLKIETMETTVWTCNGPKQYYTSTYIPETCLATRVLVCYICKGFLFNVTGIIKWRKGFVELTLPIARIWIQFFDVFLGIQIGARRLNLPCICLSDSAEALKNWHSFSFFKPTKDQ